MVTNAEQREAELQAALKSEEWSDVLKAIGEADAWIAAAPPGRPGAQSLCQGIAALARHSKWEVRRAVALSAARVLSDAYDSALERLVTDENGRVRQSANQAVLRRRDWRNAGTLGKQHESRLASLLDDVEARLGMRGRLAARRAGEEMANTFAKELYHEVIKLLTPLGMTADRIRSQLLDPTISRTQLEQEAGRMGAQVDRLRRVLDGMRAYSQLPSLLFSAEPLAEVVTEAVDVVSMADDRKATIVADVSSEPVEVDRTRMVQALVNLLANARESYDGLTSLQPIEVTGRLLDGTATVTIKDYGIGMSAEAVKDARELFVTSKLTGTGFGLPLATKIVETEHGGRLNIESKKGTGTQVTILLPIRQQS
jgi:signal transduction histidine kinase